MIVIKTNEIYKSASFCFIHFPLIDFDFLDKIFFEGNQNDHFYSSTLMVIQINIEVCQNVFIKCLYLYQNLLEL